MPKINYEKQVCNYLHTCTTCHDNYLNDKPIHHFNMIMCITLLNKSINTKTIVRIIYKI